MAPPKVAFGARTTTASRWHGSPSTSSDVCEADLQKAAAAVGPEIATEIANGKLDPSDTNAIEARRKALFAAAPQAQKCTTAVSSRHSFELDVAGAYVLALPDNTAGQTTAYSVNNATTSGYGMWLTGAILPSDSFGVLAVVRYLAQGIEGPNEQRSLDLGLRLAYAWDKFGVGLEGIYRNYFKTPTSDTYAVRIDATFDILVTDNTWVTFTAGRDYTPLNQTSLVALAGIKWNLDMGSQRTIDPANYVSTAPSAPRAPAPTITTPGSTISGAPPASVPTMPTATTITPGGSPPQP